MPSRHLPPPPSPSDLPSIRQQNNHLPLAGGVAAAFSLFFLFTFCFRKDARKRTVPSSDSDSKPPRRFSYSVLRHATSSFSPSLRLGQGGFGSVYRAALKQAPESSLNVAVKVMDSGSLQGEREFQNELLFAGKIDSKHIVSVLGFSSDRKRRRMLLVYELMEKGSLQDCLLHRKCVELKDWKIRFSIAVDIARGLEYLHHYCEPPVIHGDIKPSNVLLDANFNAKIGDFGLARVKSEVHVEIEVKREGSLRSNTVEDNGSVFEETESVLPTNGFDDFHGGVEQSPESFVPDEASRRSPENVAPMEAASPGMLSAVDLSPEGPMVSPQTVAAMVSPSEGLSPEGPMVSPRTVAAMVSPTEGLEKKSALEGNLDRLSMESGRGKGNYGDKKSGLKKNKSVTGRDWWWKQGKEGDGSGEVKDYVMEWIGKEIKKERPMSEWIGASSSSGTVAKPEKKKHRRRLDWWVSFDDDKKEKKKQKRRPAREWWKEEYCEELARKNKKKKKREGQGYTSDGCHSEGYWPRDEMLYSDKKKKKKKKSRSKSSISSMDWWLDGLSGDLWRARMNSYDSASLDIPKSGGISSTPSMRGTVCYIAPEYGGCGGLSEKCDVYSYGVLLLVIIAGRRPLQVTESPMSEFQRANLLSWSRLLARTGKLIDLVDQSVQYLDKEQALLCIKVALLCLQKSPTHRPSMKEVVGMLTGDLEPPQLPVELSPSPHSRFPFKTQKRVR